jgi:hypothetical protein
LRARGLEEAKITPVQSKKLTRFLLMTLSVHVEMPTITIKEQKHSMSILYFWRKGSSLGLESKKQRKRRKV